MMNFITKYKKNGIFICIPNSIFQISPIQIEIEKVNDSIYVSKSSQAFTDLKVLDSCSNVEKPLPYPVLYLSCLISHIFTAFTS